MAWRDIILSFLTAQICFVTIVFMALRKEKTGLVKTFIALQTLYFCWASCNSNRQGDGSFVCPCLLC